jgi:hypothetical protein
MAASVEIDERNGAPAGTLGHNIANSNFGSSDAKELVAANYPIVPGDNSFEKWQQIHVTAMGGSSKINNLKVWRTTALGGSATHLTNARTAAYGGAEVYAAPTASDSSIATEVMPTSEPASANLGIGGALAGELTDVGASDYLVHQIQTDAGDVAGAATTMHYQYDETA